MRRLFVDVYGLRPWVLLAIFAVVALAGSAVVGWADREDRRACVDTCVHQEIEPSRERCAWRCRWGQR